MAEFIQLINDISTPVKLGWGVVLVWGAAQVMWYRRGRIVPGEAQALSGAWSPGRSLLSIAPDREQAPDVESPAPISDGANAMWETMDADWFDEALRMSEAHGRSGCDPAGSTRTGGGFAPDEARQ